MSNRNSPVWVLMSPSALWLGVFFVAPLLLMAAYSLRPDMRGGLFALGWQPTLKQYQAVIEQGSYLWLLGISVGMAFMVALVATTLSYPLAYFLTFRVKASAPILLTVLILPFWTSYLLRIIAWKIILGSNGLINNLLVSSGLLHEPLALLLYSRQMVVVTLVYVWLPFVALPITAGLQRIDKSLLEAAAILGAAPWESFLRITLPLSLPGVIAGFFMVFIPTVGEYVTPLLVGGSAGSMYGNIIETFFGDGLNWPLGSALAFIMLIGVLALVGAVSRLVDLRRFVG